MNLLVTGGAGFIGSSFVRMALAQGHGITVLDALTYAGNLANLDPVKEHASFCFVKGDIRESRFIDRLLAEGHQGKPFNHLVNFAAESHVDRSIMDASVFTATNVAGVQVLLDAVRRYLAVENGRRLRFLQISTDEVYGSVADGKAFTESHLIRPNSPYAASKAAADLFVHAYRHTFGLDTLITRCSNNYGPYQFPEKLIPLAITNLMEGKKVPIYGDGLQVRDWIHCDDCSRGVLAVIERGESGGVYNLGGETPKTNLEVVRALLRATGRDESYLEFVKDRPGHDREYRIDPGKATRMLGWKPRVSFEEGLQKTVQWYRDNEPWWRAIKAGEYLAYYEKQYLRR